MLIQFQLKRYSINKKPSGYVMYGQV